MIDHLLEWEERQLRAQLPAHLAQAIGLPAGPVIVPRDELRKINETHPTDAPYLAALGQLLDGWRFAGRPPGRLGCFEVFGLLDGDWRAAVLGANRAPDVVHLITFHRVDVERVVSKRRRGNLVNREG